MKTEAEAVIAAYEKALAEARFEAQITLREAIARLQAESAESQRKVAEELARETAGGERRIEAAKRAALDLYAKSRPRWRVGRCASSPGAPPTRRVPPPRSTRRCRSADARILRDAEFWVLVAFVIAISYLVYKGKAPILAGLDARSAKIKFELDEASRLREEAQSRLAEFQRRQRDAAKEVAAIAALATGEAERAAVQGARDFEAAIERRKRLALEKIALAETKALGRGTQPRGRRRDRGGRRDARARPRRGPARHAHRRSDCRPAADAQLAQITRFRAASALPRWRRGDGSVARARRRYRRNRTCSQSA